jgi:hypothetical protein
MKFNYFFIFLAFLFQFFCFDTYDRAKITFTLNKIEGIYKNHKDKFKNHFGESTPIYGNSSSMNYYYVNIYIGDTFQKQSVIIDTGSHLTAVPCQPYIINCGRHMNSYYSMQKSNSSSLLNCNEKCKQLNYARCDPDDSCVYSNVFFELFLDIW